MRSLIRVYDAVVPGLAVVAGAMVASVFLAIVHDVALRSTGFHPPAWTSALTEYALLYMTMLGAPWLVRTRGHVFVDSIARRFGPALRQRVEAGVYGLCILICLVLSYYAIDQGLAAAARGEEDWRSIVMPRWVLFAAMPIGFIPCALEFLRFLLGPDSMYASGRSAGSL